MDIKKEVRKINKSITEATFSVACMAYSDSHIGPAKASVPIKVEGLDEHTKRKDILGALRKHAVTKFLNDLTVKEWEKNLSKIEDESPLKAWLVSIVWFGFAPENQNHETTPAWREFYNPYKEQYLKAQKEKELDGEIEDVVEMAKQIGLPSWLITRDGMTPTRLKTKLKRLSA